MCPGQQRSVCPWESVRETARRWQHSTAASTAALLAAATILALVPTSCRRPDLESAGTPAKVDAVEEPARAAVPPDSPPHAEPSPDQATASSPRTDDPGPPHLSETELAEAETGPILLHDVTAEAGITFRHTDGSSGRLFVVETVASGVATFDYDLDGLIDIYFVNGGALPGTAFDEPPRNRLYRNLGDWRFVDVTDEAGVGDTRHGLGATVGDYNNDGYPDLYVSNLGENVLYRNNGDGSFTDVSVRSGTAVADPVRTGAGVCFLDIENDGDLDLFVANYLKFSPDQPMVHMYRGRRIYVGPERYPPYPNTLLRNNGDETFTDVSEESGIAAHPGWGMGIVCGDFDRDGAVDVFVGNDGGPGNFVFMNDGQGVFQEMGVATGAAYSGQGLAHGSMGADCADYDHDGWMDLFVTSYQRQLGTLFRNQEGSSFEDVTQRTGAGLGSFNQVTWGCGLVDLDNDGLRDIFYASGHLLDNVDEFDDSTSYLATPVVLQQQPGGRFVNVSATSGSGLRKRSVGRGTAFDDLDNDGDLDVVILNSRRTSTLLRNDSLVANHWLEIRLIGTAANRDAVGAWVTVTAGGQQQMAEVRSGRGYQGHFGTILHFGLGSSDKVDTIEVRWPGGGTARREEVAADTKITILERSDPQ